MKKPEKKELPYPEHTFEKTEGDVLTIEMMRNAKKMMINRDYIQKVSACNDCHDLLTAYYEAELKKQQKVNNEVLADKCDELDKFAEKQSELLKEVLGVYEKYIPNEKDIEHWCPANRDDVRNVMWNAIKNLAERGRGE